MNVPFIFLITMTNPPIERIGESCPIGYWRSGAYCVQSPGLLRRRQALPAYGPGDCPIGWHKTANYCVRTNYQ
jgi:hypothetical protein